jgi:flap endonuclease-1
MGIKNLNKLIKENAPGCVKTVKSLTEFDLWPIGFDASLVIYQLVSVGIKYNIKNKEGKYINHIQGVFFRMLKMILSGLTPVMVFDGIPPKLKSATLTKRKEARDAGTNVRVPREVFGEVKKLLELMGVKVIQAPSEAEAEIAVLTQTGVLTACASEDTDVLAFGSKRMIKGLDTAAKNMTVIGHDELLSELKLTREQFVDLCILLGSDYSPGLPKVGPKRALALVREYGTIEKILAGEKIKPPTEFNFIGARNEFINPVVSREKFDPVIRKLYAEDIEFLREFLITTHGLEPSRVNKSLVELAKFHSV